MNAVLRSLRSSHPPGFLPPDFSSPVEVQEWVRRIPSQAMGKGMFLARLLSELDRRGLPRPTNERFLPFTDYPLRRCLEVNVECAHRLYPGVPTREALRRVAWLSFETFSSSLIGQVLFGAVGRDVGSILRLASRSLAYATNVGTQEADVLDGRSAMLHFSDAYLCAEAFGAGIIEGVLHACGKEGEVLVSMSTPVDGSFFVSWRDPVSGVVPRMK